LQIGSAVAVVWSVGVASVLTPEDAGEDVYLTVVSVGRETFLCAWLLGRKDVEAVDCLGGVALGYSGGEGEEKYRDKSFRKSIMEIHYR
jgi:hypothetical protein